MEKKTKNNLGNLGKIPLFLSEHFLFSFFLVIFCVIFLANLLFYKYYILNQEITTISEQGQVVINEKSYNNLLKIWEEQDIKFQTSESKIYINILEAR